jgi:heme oxygenase
VSPALIESTSVLAQLREVTRPAHQRLEARLRLLDEQLSHQDYRYILTRFYGFWCSWEPLVERLVNDLAFTFPRQRLHMLARDLAALGFSQAMLDALPICPPLPLQDAAAALGSLYVMEGSTLGGRIIEQHLHRLLGIRRETGGSYFAGYGDRTGLMWRNFLDRLDATPVTAAARINSGATETFACLTAWLPPPADTRLA